MTIKPWFQVKLSLLINFLRKPESVVLLSFSLFCSWLLLILTTAGRYQNLTNTDPLAMIHVLFPKFWLILLTFIVLCFLVFQYIDAQQWLHIFLLAQLSLMLFYTPFLLGGFSWSPDSLWHGGVATYIPQILSGEKIYMTQYGQSYPLSFLITYIVEHLLRVDVFTYTLYIFPPVCICLFSTLAYLFISRIFTSKTAFVSMLLVLPTLHYFEPHVSPFAMGTLLVSASLVLLTYNNLKAFILSIFLILPLVITHPISPIFLGIYIFASIIVNSLFRKISFTTTRVTGQILRFTLLLVFLVFYWLYITIYRAGPNYPAVEISLEKILSLEFLQKLVQALEWTVGKDQFIFSQISQLGLATYGIFIVVTGLIFVSNILHFLRNRKTNIDPGVLWRLTLSFTALASAAMGYMLFLSSGERFLLGRGLLFFTLMGAACIATYLVTINRSRLRLLLAFGFILFLICSFPIVSYSKEAYNTFTPSANSGLSFIGTFLDVSHLTLSMGQDQQLASYVNLSQGLQLVEFYELLNRFALGLDTPDIIVLRINAYYVISMRYDGSFENNTYTQLHNILTTHPSYMKAYSNSAFEMYIKTSYLF